MSWIDQIQSLDDAAKKRVLIITTAVVMAVVIYFWLVYFNNMIAAFSVQSAPTSIMESVPAESTGTAEQAPAGPGILQRIGYGFDALGQSFMDAARGLGNILQSPRQYIVQPPQ